MTIRYPCPLSTCTWFTKYVASTPGPEYVADVLSWSPATWAIVSERVGSILSVGQVIDAHLVTHSPVEWMAELRRIQARAEDAEAQLDRLLETLEQTANVAAGMHPVTSMRMPSRADVEATRAALAGAVGGEDRA